MNDAIGVRARVLGGMAGWVRGGRAGQHDLDSLAPHSLAQDSLAQDSLASASSRRREGIVQDGFEQSAALGPGDAELRFELIANGHQLVHLGHDTVLFGQRRKGNHHVQQDRLDGLKKIVKLAPQLAALIGFAGWRQSKSLFRKAKRANRELSRLKKNAGYQQRLEDGYQKLFHITDLLLPRLQDLLDAALDRLPTEDGTSGIGNVAGLCNQLTYWQAITEHVLNTAWRRVMEREKICSQSRGSGRTQSPMTESPGPPSSSVIV